MDGLIYIGAAQALYTAFLIGSLKAKHLGNKILIAWLLTIAFSLVIVILKHNHILSVHSAWGAPVILTFGPFFLLYINAMTDEDPTFSPKMLCHFIPFLLFSFLPLDSVFSKDKFFQNDHLLIIRILFSSTVLVSLFVYNWLTIVKLKKHREHLKEHFSFSTEKITLYWLFLLSFFFSVSWTLLILAGLFFNNPSITEYIYFSINLLFTYLISYLGFKQPIIFDPERTVHIPTWVKEKYPDLSESIKTDNPKYEKSGLKPEVADEYVKTLLRYMEEEKAYLNGGLSIQDLSDELNIPKHYLTQVINENLKKNFYTFVNEYRINAVKEMISNPQYDYLTLLAIAYECGFNSKSSFNNTFKQITGLTPSEYKRSIEKSTPKAIR